MDLKKEVLVVLGAPNSPTGELSTISKSRLDHCANLYSRGKLVLCTGGWGEHFNTSSEAHGIYTQRYLIEKGIYEGDFLDIALSENTVEDAVKVKQIIAGLNDPRLTIITSDYHLERVQLIFNEILKGIDVNCIGVKCNMKNDQLQELIEHEKKAIKSIQKNGLYY